MLGRCRFMCDVQAACRNEKGLFPPFFPPLDLSRECGSILSEVHQLHHPHAAVEYAHVQSISEKSSSLSLLTPLHFCGGVWVLSAALVLLLLLFHHHINCYFGNTLQ